MADYRHRRPRYYDEDSDGSVDDYPPPKPRNSERRPPPPKERDSRAPRDIRDDIPPPPMGAPSPQQQRPSILVDPEETSSQRARRRPRSRSNVRIQTSDDDNDYDRPRGGGQQKPRDLESKDTDDHRRFRAKRDGYESDEAVEHRRAAPRTQRQAPPRAYDDEPPRQKRGEPRDERSLPLRGKPRDALEDAALAGGAGAVSGAASPRVSRRRTYKEPGSRARYEDDDEPPRRDEARAPRRRDAGYDDPGYRSDAVRPRHAQPPRRKEHDEYDDYDRPRRRDDAAGYRSGGERRPPAPHDYYSDYREDRAPRRGDPRRDTRYRDDDRRRDERPRSSRGGKAAGMVPKEWQKEASAAFMTYAFPIIKKEGPKYLKQFLAKQGGSR